MMVVRVLSEMGSMCVLNGCGRGGFWIGICGLLCGFMVGCLSVCLDLIQSRNLFLPPLSLGLPHQLSLSFTQPTFNLSR